MEKETAGEEVKGKTNEEEVLKDGKSPENQTEERDQEHKGSKSEGDRDEINDKAIPEIVISSPKEEPEGFLITQLQKAREGEGGEGDVSAQDSQVTKNEDEKQVKGSLESTSEQEHSGILHEKEERGTDKSEKDREKEDSASEEKDPAKLSEGTDEAQTKHEDDVDTSTEEKSKEKGLGRDLPPIDISQLESRLQQPDNGPTSPGIEEGDAESPTYLNYVQDDDVCLDNLGSAAAKTSGNVTPLDPISEQDESEDEKDEDKTRKISIPTLFKSKFSSGMDNLSALPGDEDNAAQDTPSADEAQNDKEDNNASQDAGDENAAKAQSSSESETENDKEDKTTDAAPVASSAIAPDATKEEAATKGKRRRRRKKGKITREPQSPIFIREGVRTFKNPMSYLGGPNIKYEDEGEGEEGAGGRRGSRQRNDSIASTTSLD